MHSHQTSSALLMSWQHPTTRVKHIILLVLLYATAHAPISCTEIVCEALPQAGAASQSGNVSTIPTVYGFPAGPAYQVMVTVERIPGVGLSFEGEGAVIDPQAGTSVTDRGVIIIPETGVAPEAYAPYAQKVATKGFYAAILENNTNPGLVLSVMLARPTLTYWGLVGHGAGGVLAANLAQVLQSKVTFLTLLAAPITANLSGLNLAVAAGYSTSDDVIVSTSISNLPSDALVVSFPRLDHFGFAQSTCGGNWTASNNTNPVSESVTLTAQLLSLVTLPLVHAIWLPATPNSLSYTNNALLTPGGNASKPYPVNSNYTVSFSSVPVPSTSPQRSWGVFTPVPASATSPGVKGGIAFYTGTSVDARAYYQIAFELATYGYLVAIIESPLRASFSPEALYGAGDVINSTDPAFSSVPSGFWAVAGHSAGGVAAASYAYAYPDSVRAVVMYAGAFIPGVSFVNTSLPVLGIVGQLDGTLLASLADTEASFKTSTNSSVSKFVVVPGANHAGTGDYGQQPFDNFATISGDQQRRTFASLTANFLDPIFKA